MLRNLLVVGKRAQPRHVELDGMVDQSADVQAVVREVAAGQLPVLGGVGVPPVVPEVR